MAEGKLTKEELREDPLVTALAELKTFIQTQGNVLAIVLAVVIALGAGFLIVRRVAARAEQAAAVLLIEGEGQYMSENPTEALNKFQQAMDRHKNTRSGKIAMLRVADCQLELGNLEEARRLYQRFLDRAPRDGLVRSSALRGLASTLDTMGQKEEAGRTFLKAAEIAASPMRPDDLVSAGNAFLDAGKAGEAEAAFQKVIETFPESPRVRDAREGLEMAKARAGAP